jgi:molecular chaperone DnaK
MDEINNHPTTEKLHPIVCSIIELMPKEEVEKADGLLK